jgi:hypothetical protein
MRTDSRTELAARQAALVSALAGQTECPAGLAADRLQATAASLAQKRRESVARAWPGVAAALGVRFRERFEAFARTAPLPRSGGPLLDGRAFLRWLDTIGACPDAVRLEAMAFDLRFRWTPHCLASRRMFAFKARVVARRLVFAIRAPWLGEHWWSLPLHWR